jgi:hypothetical protein
MVIHWGKEKNRKQYFNGTKSGIKDFDFQTRQSEFGHLAAFAAISLTCIWLLPMGHVRIALLTMALNIPFNLYPVILQRIHRVQIQRLTKRVNS